MQNSKSEKQSIFLKLIVTIVAIAQLTCTLNPVYASEQVQVNAEAKMPIESNRMEQNDFSILRINSKNAIVNGQNVEISQPILVFDRTYVDLYRIGNMMDVAVEWVGAEVGYFKVKSAQGEVDFSLISVYDDLKIQYKFFVKDGIIYVSLRELANLAGYNVMYENGTIILSQRVLDTFPVKNTLNKSDLWTHDDYIYSKYFYNPEYVVYPYEAYSYDLLKSDIARLQKLYPDIIKSYSIGKSVEGRDLDLVEFGRGKRKIFVVGTHHAREYIATTYLMYAIDRFSYLYRTNQMFENYNIRDMLSNVTFYIVPMVNPDGVHLVQNGVDSMQNPDYIKSMSINEGSRYGYRAWKANANGVDVNWNYDKDWSIEKNSGPRGSNGFNGDAPGTEPETIAVTNFVNQHQFEAFLSFHTQGSVFYYGEDMDRPTALDKVLKDKTGFTPYYEHATGVGGSFFDYVYRNFRRVTITFELCKYIGNYPYPDSDFDAVWRPASAILPVVANEITYLNP